MINYRIPCIHGNRAGDSTSWYIRWLVSRLLLLLWLLGRDISVITLLRWWRLLTRWYWLLVSRLLCLLWWNVGGIALLARRELLI
jgi:hypothetical protein